MNTNERAIEFRRAVARLGEALALCAGNPLGIDASIQRFEFCIELAWKTLRGILLRDHGIEVASPKPALQEAFRVGLIDDETQWLSMLRDRIRRGSTVCCVPTCRRIRRLMQSAERQTRIASPPPKNCTT